MGELLGTMLVPHDQALWSHNWLDQELTSAQMSQSDAENEKLVQPRLLP